MISETFEMLKANSFLMADSFRSWKLRSLDEDCNDSEESGPRKVVWTIPVAEILDELKKEGVVEVISEEEFRARLRAGMDDPDEKMK